jgi:HK97 family phage major capsid protein
MTDFNPTPAEFAAWRATHPPIAGGDPAADAEAAFGKIAERLTALEAQAAAAVEAAQADPSKYVEMKALIEGTDGQPGLRQQVEELRAEKEEARKEAEQKALRAEVTDLKSVIDDLRQPTAEFRPGAEGKALPVDDAYADGSHSIFADIRAANKGSQTARERLTQGLVAPEGVKMQEGKAMTEGVDAQGGYLVRPAVERQIVETKELDNVLRGLCSRINVTTNAIQLDQLTLSTTAGWVAELAQKPETTGMTLATVTASVFTAAGLATISNQLLADSNPSVDNLVTSDLAKRLTALEETAFLAGTGTNQPLGILNTPGLQATALTSTAVVDLLAAILDAIAQVETDHGAPTGILMHPRTWTRILKAQFASGSQAGAYMIQPGAGYQDPRTGVRGPARNLWGYPVYTTNRMPTNLGGGTESRVIVGDFSEALILDRQGITVDESPHVYFTTNQTVFRAEMRVGFTAARTPTAFNVIGGAGLAAG